jgi:hypothetical protein
MATGLSKSQHMHKLEMSGGSSEEEGISEEELLLTLGLY